LANQGLAGNHGDSLLRAAFSTTPAADAQI